MQPREAFKIGFLARCVEEGMSPDTTQNLIKQAVVPFGLSDITGAAKDIAGAATGVAKPLLYAGLAAPPVLGGVAAYLSNRATDTDATDVEEIKQKELVDTYKRMADQLRRQKQLREYKQQRQQTGRIFL